MPFYNAEVTYEEGIGLIARGVPVSDLGGGGGGASAFTDLTDKASANLPVENGPLGTALAAKAPTISPALTGTPTVPTATVGTNTTQAASTAFVRTEIAAVINSAPGVLDTLDELAAALGDDSNFAATVAASLAGKASLLGPVNLGTGAIALNAADHANRALRWGGSSPRTVTIDTTDGAIGDIYSIANVGSAVITMPGAAGTGYKLGIDPNTVGAVEWEGSTSFLSLIPDATGGGASAPAAISGTTAVGDTLTCTPGSGWFGAFQWQADGVDISGATSATYVIEDSEVDYRCKFAGLFYTNVITSDVAAAGGVMDVTTGSGLTGENLDTQGYIDWYFMRGSGGGGADKSMYGGAGIGANAYSGTMERYGGPELGGAFDWNGTEQDGAGASASGVGDCGALRLTSGGGAPGAFEWLIAGDSVERIFRFKVGVYDNTSNAPAITFDLDDDSVTPVTVNPAPGGGDMTFYVYQVNFTCADNTVNLRMRIDMDNSPETCGVFPKMLTLEVA